jgi:5-methylcytosine-specific restriction endonuclease McrA
MPCHPARARQLLKAGQAAVLRRYPLTLILTQREGGEVQPVEVRIDPGSKVTGLSLVALLGETWRVLWAANLSHRGQAIKQALDKRRAVRRSRRNRKTRYRKARFNNRRRPEGWLAPSLRSRVENVATWTTRLIRLTPVCGIAVETIRFDPQKMIDPEITGVEYQQGTLYGYELRQYLLEKWGRACAYCGARDLPLQVEHISPRSRGGSDRVSNLTLACQGCNTAKGNQDIRDFLAYDPARLERLLDQAQAPLRDAAAINTIRWAIGNRLKQAGLPVAFWSGGRTKFNRIKQGYPKDHWVDASCVGEQPALIPTGLKPLLIKAVGYGSRQMCLMDKYGFPRTSPKQSGRVKGFKTGDMVIAIVPTGKKAGKHLDRWRFGPPAPFGWARWTGSASGIAACSITQMATNTRRMRLSSQR